MSVQLFDTHVHLCDEQFGANAEAVIARAAAVGVSELLTVATDVATSLACLELARLHASVWSSVGIHPNYTSQAGSDAWWHIERLADDPRVVALGETGLDRHWDDSPFELQQEFFARHLALSRRCGKPVIVHMRDCEDDVRQMVREAAHAGPIRGILHSFTGSVEGARECLELGMMISFAGMVTYKKSDDLRAVAREIPDDRLLIETDAPYLSPHPCRGQRPNEPALMIHTAACLAEVRGVSLEELARQTTANARRVLRIQ